MTGRIFGSLFNEGRTFIGVVHLPALPGSPGWAGSMDQVLDRNRKLLNKTVQKWGFRTKSRR